VPDAGETLRVAVVPELTTCVKPSDQVRLNGAVPVKAAVMFVEPPAQIVAVPLDVAVGVGRIVTFCEPLAEQPLCATVTFRVTLPDEPASNVIAFVPRPPVIVPLVIDQE
jgi:hypothetical protein